jgi:hypothetical protein
MKTLVIVVFVLGLAMALGFSGAAGVGPLAVG